jgi:hypothetical protein
LVVRQGTPNERGRNVKLERKKTLLAAGGVLLVALVVLNVPVPASYADVIVRKATCRTVFGGQGIAGGASGGPPSFGYLVRIEPGRDALDVDGLRIVGIDVAGRSVDRWRAYNHRGKWIDLGFPRAKEEGPDAEVTIYYRWYFLKRSLTVSGFRRDSIAPPSLPPQTRAF